MPDEAGSDRPAAVAGPAHCVALGVEYDGSAFSGFQRQRHVGSVQQALERAASAVADEPVQVAAAGRTDAGVHATQQVVSFRTNAARPPDAWRRGISSLTPPSVGVVWAKCPAAVFHARFDALWRRYMYVFSDAPAPPVVGRSLMGWSRQRPLDVAAMHRAAQCLVGEHDFSAFRAAGCQSRSPRRRVHRARVRRWHGYVAIDVVANAFLLRMVRNIAGALRAVGAGDLSAAAVRSLLHGRDRRLAPPTAPAAGLYLVAVGYRQWRLPARLPPVLGVAPDDADGQPRAGSAPAAVLR